MAMNGTMMIVSSGLDGSKRIPHDHYGTCPTEPWVLPLVLPTVVYVGSLHCTHSRKMAFTLHALCWLYSASTVFLCCLPACFWSLHTFRPSTPPGFMCLLLLSDHGTKISGTGQHLCRRLECLLLFSDVRHPLCIL